MAGPWHGDGAGLRVQHPRRSKIFCLYRCAARKRIRHNENVDYEINYEVSEKGYLRIWATSEQLNTLVKYITGTNAGLSGDVSRLNFAKLICQLTGRDTDPDTSAYSGHIQYFTDSGSSEDLITEVSHEHDYVLDTDGNEYWI